MSDAPVDPSLPDDSLVAELEFVLRGPGDPAIVISPPPPRRDDEAPHVPHAVTIAVTGMSVEQVGKYFAFLAHAIEAGLQDGLVGGGFVLGDDL